MYKTWIRMGIALAMGLISQVALATGLGKVDNFVLIDQQGEAHELYYHKDASAIVLMIQGNGCQIVRSTLPDLKKVRDAYADRGVKMFMLNANPQDTRQSIQQEAKEWDIDFPILDDSSQIIAKALKVNRTGEVLVINPKNWEIIYRGPISDRVAVYERQKAAASKHYLRDALDAVLNGQEVAEKEVFSPGCIINFGQVDGAQISYAETIAPILQKNCTGCHVVGGIAPWPMSNYEIVRGFAPMMREVIRTRRMPPWHADPAVGHWKNDVGLTDEDKRALISWIEAGTPRGEGEDPLKSIPPLESQWELGEPDLVIDIPEYEVAASGVIEYQYPSVKNPLDRDVWVTAATILPGNPKVVHHILAGASKEAIEAKDTNSNFLGNLLITYAPGNGSAVMPQNSGIFVPKGGYFQFQMHYTPYGKKAVDRSKLGLYFADKPPENFYREVVILNFAIEIPANAEAHEEQGYFTFWEDAEIDELFPHSHYRGRSSTFELLHPNGETETILSVPDYDFNWQRSYKLDKPKAVKAGTKILHRTVYNNSAKNPSNPDPNKKVWWGEQSHQEMLFGSVRFRWTKEKSSAPLHDVDRAFLDIYVSNFDKNIDGVISKDEMSTSFLQSSGVAWSDLDQDANGTLDHNETARFVQMLK